MNVNSNFSPISLSAWVKSREPQCCKVGKYEPGLTDQTHHECSFCLAISLLGWILIFLFCSPRLYFKHPFAIPSLDFPTAPLYGLSCIPLYLPGNGQLSSVWVCVCVCVCVKLRLYSVCLYWMLWVASTGWLKGNEMIHRCTVSILKHI